MAIFGRRSARQRLRSAARESLAIPAFSAPVDCSTWVLGGLWPAELATVSAETAPLADYLNADLRRIANSANEKLHAISRSGLAGQARQAAEARVINVARAFAVLRVESTVRQLHKEALEIRAEYAGLTAAPVTVDPAAQIPPEPAAPQPPRPAVDQAPRPARHRMPEAIVVEPVVEPPVEPVAPAKESPTPPAATAAPAVVPEGAPEPEVAPPPPAPPVPAPEVAETLEKVESARVEPPSPVEPIIIDSVDEQSPPIVSPAEPTIVSPSDPVVPLAPAAAASPPAEPAVAESEDRRLQRLLAFVARQEPGLRWAVGTRADGSTLLVTDVANGWIPSGIELPAGVQVPKPGRRTGTATEMLGTTIESATYTPGDRLGWASDFAATETSVQPRDLPMIDDLGWHLSKATHWRDGLPRMANTLAKAGSAGTGVVDAEIDLLRVHLDTMRYQLLAQYPDTDAAQVLNCTLLAATEGIATGDMVSANYHYSWFRALTAPPAGQWDPQT